MRFLVKLLVTLSISLRNYSYKHHLVCICIKCIYSLRVYNFVVYSRKYGLQVKDKVKLLPETHMSLIWPENLHFPFLYLIRK